MGELEFEHAGVHFGLVSDWTAAGSSKEEVEGDDG